MNYIELSYWDLVAGGVLVVLAAGISLYLQLGLEKRLAIAAVRMVVQLLLVGLVLKLLFSLVSPFLSLLTALCMIGFAGREVMARQDGGMPRLLSYGIGSVAMLMSAGIVTMFALTAQLQPDPWYNPRYALPLLGMVLGNCMTGIALGLQALTTGASQNRLGIEARLALGADRMSALKPVLRQSLRTALMPIINSMSAIGLVSLPGMMTGQILAGADPVEAVKYQILVMSLIAGGTALGAVGAVVALAYRITDNRHRLRLDRLSREGI